MPRTALAQRLPLVPWSTCVWLCLACSPSDEGATADGGAAAGGAPTGGASSPADAGAGGANVADAEIPEVAAWQVLDLSGLGRVRDVVAVGAGMVPEAVLATDRGLFRLTPEGVAAIDSPEVAGGYAAVDFSPTSGLYAIGADGATMALGPAAGPLGALTFTASIPYVEVVASPTTFFGLRAPDRVAIYESRPGGAVPITGLTGAATAVVAEGPQHLVALPESIFALDAASGTPLLLTAAGDVLWFGLPSQAPSFAAPDPSGADAGTPEPVPPDAGPACVPPQLRVLSLNHGAVVDGCLDRRPFEGPYDRVGNQGGQTASGYSPISEGPHRFQTDVYFMPDHRCRDIDEDAEFTARPGKLYTALIWELLGFSSVEVWSSDVPPRDGVTRGRADGALRPGVDRGREAAAFLETG